MDKKNAFADSVKIVYEDGSESLLLPNLELRFIRGPKRRRVNKAVTVETEVSLF